MDAGQGRRRRPPNISSLSRGRGKLGPAPVRFLFEQVAGPAGEQGTPGVFCCGLRVVSIDGSTSDVPDSKVNDEHFGRPSNQTRDRAFAQVRWLAAAESGTESLLGASLGPYRASEQALARDLLDQGCLGPGMLMLADRKFLSWALPPARPPGRRRIGMGAARRNGTKRIAGVFMVRFKLAVAAAVTGGVLAGGGWRCHPRRRRPRWARS